VKSGEKCEKRVSHVQKNMFQAKPTTSPEKLCQTVPNGSIFSYIFKIFSASWEEMAPSRTFPVMFMFCIIIYTVPKSKRRFVTLSPLVMYFGINAEI
jgi:hypothetical protein